MVTQIHVDSGKVLALLERDGSREFGVLRTGEVEFLEDGTLAAIPAVGDHQESTACELDVSDLG